MSVIYIDVLIVLNIYITYFLLKATAKISHTPVTVFRVTSAAAAGSLSSLVILADLNYPAVFLIKAASAFAITFIAFGKQEFVHFIKLTVSFYIMNFIFAGLIMGIGEISGSDYIIVKSTVVYYDVSLISLIILTAFSYFLVCGIRFILDKNNASDGMYRITITNCDHSVSLKGLADTGNALVDVFSGRPVIICPPDVLDQLTGRSVSENDIYTYMLSDKRISGVRLVPFSTISGEGTVPAFIPEKVVISNEKSSRTADVLIGINSAQKEAIFNPRLIF